MARPVALRYFAALDPMDPSLMTYWRRTLRGEIVPLESTGYRKSILRSEVPHRRGSPEQKAWLADYWTRVRAARQEIISTILADEVVAAARFATAWTACCCCRRPLTDPQSRAMGIGPECGGRLAPDARDAVAHESARQHAARLEVTP